MTHNALDPAPLRRSNPPHRRIAAIVVGVVIAVGVVFALVHFLHPAAPAGRAGFGAAGSVEGAGFSRGGGGGAATEPPPAVTAEAAAATTANLRAAQRAADSPALANHPVQVAAVSPPAGPPARGLGVTHPTPQIGPSDG